MKKVVVELEYDETTWPEGEGARGQIVRMIGDVVDSTLRRYEVEPAGEPRVSLEDADPPS